MGAAGRGTPVGAATATFVAALAGRVTGDGAAGTAAGPGVSADVTGGGVMGMADMFRELKRTADDNHSAALVVSMPCAAYLGGHAAEILRRVGFNIPDALNGNRSSDEIVGRAAAMGDLPFISLLDDFQDANVDGFFLPFDGHYTSDGARFFAGALKSRLYPILAQMRKTLHVSGVKIENR